MINFKTFILTLTILSAQAASANIFGTGATDKPKRPLPEQCKPVERVVLGKVIKTRTVDFIARDASAGVYMCVETICKPYFSGTSARCDRGVEREAFANREITSLCAKNLENAECEADADWIPSGVSSYPSCLSIQESQTLIVTKKLVGAELKKARCEKLDECIPNLPARDVRVAQQWENEFGCGK